MNALSSYLRHLIVTGILIAVEKLKLPIEGASDAANVIALAIVGTVSWWFVKFVGPKLKVPKSSSLPIIIAFALSFATPSCSTLSPQQTDRIIDSAIPVFRDIVIRATK